MSRYRPHQAEIIDAAWKAELQEFVRRPWRPDLDWRWHETALRIGCMMSINPDAHSTRELDLTHWGVEMARKGGISKERILNCLSTEEFAQYLEGRRDLHRGKHSVPRRRIPRMRALTAGTKKASPAARKRKSVAS
jgi:hypothetical protein